MNLNLTKGVDIFSLLSKKPETKLSIFDEINKDFEEYPDLRKISIYVKHAIINEDQIQFEDLLQFNYVFGEFHEKKNSPLYTYSEKLIKISHVPGHVIHKFTGLDKLFKKPENQDSEAFILIETKNEEEIKKVHADFIQTGKFIRKYIKMYRDKYVELEECFHLNARGIQDIEWGVPPTVGFIKGLSLDNYDYTYSYRYNEIPNDLIRLFKYMTIEEIEKSQKDRDHRLYNPIHKKMSRDLLDIQQKLTKYLSPVEKYCDPLFGDQKYIIEHHDNNLKITYKVKVVKNFQIELHGLMPGFPDGYKLLKTDFEKADNLTWGVLFFEYNQ